MFAPVKHPILRGPEYPVVTDGVRSVAPAPTTRGVGGRAASPIAAPGADPFFIHSAS